MAAGGSVTGGAMMKIMAHQHLHLEGEVVEVQVASSSQQQLRSLIRKSVSWQQVCGGRRFQASTAGAVQCMKVAPRALSGSNWLPY
jgi:hypothetical protein